MAIYHASMKPLSRSDGRSAVAAAAYRAGVRLEDARTGLIHDYSRRSGVVCAEILTPDGGPADRAQLWNAAETAERRKDARTGREWVLALPEELDAEQRRELARGFAQQLVDRYGVAVDMAIHEPSREGDERNHHVHVFATTRQVSRDESGALVMGEKAACELSDHKRKALDPTMKPAAEEVTELRQLWERLANEALERAGSAERIDSRSLEAQGIDREPTAHVGPSATAMERRGEASERGEINRQVEARNAEREALQAEIIDLKAERERRAKEAQEQRAREEAEAKARQEAARLEEARKAREQDRQRWEAMSFMERRREMTRLRPPALETLIEQDETMKAAQSRQQEAEERRSFTAQEVEAWRERHGLRTWLHDRKLFRSAELETRERSREEARRSAEEAAQSLGATRKEATDRITEAQKPAQERFAAFMEVNERKEQEAALAASREAQARKEAEEQVKATQAREAAQKAAREAAEREAARKAEEQARAAKEREEEAKRAAARKVEAEREAAEKRQRIAAAKEAMKDPAQAQKMRDSFAAQLAKMPEGPKREEASRNLAEFEKVTGTRERTQREIENQKLAEFAQKRREAKQREKDRGWDRDR